MAGLPAGSKTVPRPVSAPAPITFSKAALIQAEQFQLLTTELQLPTDEYSLSAYCQGVSTLICCGVGSTMVHRAACKKLPCFCFWCCRDHGCMLESTA